MAVTGSTSGFKVKSQDIATRLVSKDYLLDVYPNLASASGARKSPGMWAWGNNRYGHLGIGAPVDVNLSYSSPVQIGALTNWKQIGMGPTVTPTFIKTDGTLWACGYNGSGSMGINASALVSYSSPIQIGALTTWKQVSSGFNLAAAIKTDGTLWAWGGNANYGPLGNGTTVSYSSPIQIGTLTNWKTVRAAGYHILAMKNDGSIWTCGGNWNGQLGLGTTSTYSSPVQIGSLTNWKQISVGMYHTISLKTDGTLWTWGWNGYGAIGNNTTINYNSPVQIGTSSDWQSVFATYAGSFAIKNSGALWAWGYNTNGALGNGATINYSSPVQVGLLTNWRYVGGHSGGPTTYFIKTDGTLWGSGSNSRGELGNGTVVHYSSPIQIGSLTTWKQIEGAYEFSAIGIADGYY